ncbi:inositol-pentakisphosphate 2-kinase [Gigaspora rosea]|uniref:Inositol-pentakisphosphate 2-kinase n=1 Tax=Gigaspora rosea TaxID=44941 RepID=A0A397U327_9GLOM|nr:inositol-pentakisphosphate 2-kinase [Gigaspora rosea]
MLHIEVIPELYHKNLWKYKAEGNVNVVLVFIGKNERFFGTVLRLRKTIISNQDTSIDNETFEDQHLSVSYASSVIGPLLGDEYISKSILLKVPQTFLKELSKAILPMRPENRIYKDIDFNQHYGILTYDHTIFASDTNPTLSIELKPKWAFLPSSPFINSEKFHSCRFCMHKYFKKKVSNYCPLDLFSLDEVRLKRAIKELLSNPNNNLKMFIQGMQIHIGQDDWPTQLYEFFNFDQSSTDHKTQHQIVDQKNLLVMLLLCTILEEQILFKRLKQLQKTLDELDIEGIYKLFLEQRSNLHDPTIEEWQLIVKEYEQRIKSPSVPHLSMDGAQMRQRIYEFLMSTTLKDCSIIFTFQKSRFSDETKVADDTSLFFKEKVKFIPFSSDKIYFKYKVNVIDLDPKSVTKIPYYYDLDAMIVNNYMKCDDITKKKCIE